jgi:hypothetical protein
MSNAVQPDLAMLTGDLISKSMTHSKTVSPS